LIAARSRQLGAVNAQQEPQIPKSKTKTATVMPMVGKVGMRWCSSVDGAHTNPTALLSQATRAPHAQLG
jgi:hypothetical protein